MFIRCWMEPMNKKCRKGPMRGDKMRKKGEEWGDGKDWVAGFQEWQYWREVDYSDEGRVREILQF